MEKSFAVCEEMMDSVTISDKKERDCVICPKPRRLTQLDYTVNDSKAGIDLLDIIFSKGGQDTEHSNHINSSPPFFCGSPPSRATNPLVQDARFGDRKVNPSSPLSNMSLSPTSLTWKGGCARTKFGQKPAAVRIEGFDCLNKDRRSCNISAVA